MKTRKNAEARIPEILQNFYLTIVEEGIEGASIGKIAKRMNIHPSLIMHYFSTKENMTLALVDYIIEEYSKLILSIQMETHDPHDRLERLIDILWSDEWYKMTDISVDFSVLAMSFRSEEINSRLQLLFSSYKSFLVKEMKDFIEAGVVRFSNPERAAEVIMTLIEGNRHFKHFFVNSDDSENYRLDMKRMILCLLKNGDKVE